MVRKNGYKGNFDCAKKKILNLLNYLIKKDKNSIIIFLGDHGPHLIKKVNEFSEHHNLLDKNSNHVNLFRIVFNCISKDTNYLLENKIYFHDVSNNKLKSKIYRLDEIKTIKN